MENVKRYEIHAMQKNIEVVDTYLRLFEFFKGITEEEKSKYEIESIVFKKFSLFVNFKNGDTLLLYFRKFKYFTNDVSRLNEIINGLSKFINIIGEKVYIANVYYYDVYYRIVDNESKILIS